jgi:ribose transport system permease protein
MTFQPNLSMRPWRRRIAKAAPDYGVPMLFILMCVVFTFTLPGKFATGDNFTLLLNTQAIAGILALAVMVPLAAGEFDLSIAANLGFCSILSAWMASNGKPLLLVFLAPLVVGALIGLLNAFFTVVVGVNAFIATLGMSTILAGGNLWLTGGQTIYQNIGESVTRLAITKVGDVQIVVVYFALITIAIWYLFERTPFGRYLRATGLGREASKLSGVRTSGYLFAAFIIAAACCWQRSSDPLRPAWAPRSSYPPTQQHSWVPR